ncbi:MAG: GTP pyrophosphokinase [Desulfuromonadales bacterium GWD2_61_12]|nr:MAG: GTP pyrophosphokinase [Desulfuromonadales bacterium GWC2_61_20]OGR34092.1 MAG: GTP pyrophosphokinase [Desulfuromonadales bacterium GWD2_61_12]HAD04803.1 GTP pyrophosphokinase [Desulfuromonas sp.]HBT82322.1 GTP pyrophosphokinase [Desulfuromonas sp.]
MVRLEDILANILAYNSSADLDPVRKAYAFCAKVHQGQVRLSGEAYLIHPMEVALVLTELKMDVATIVTGLLHDTLEDTLTTAEELRTLFGEEVVDLVDGVTKLSKITFRTSEERQAENFRKMLLAMARDIRVVMVKLADRLHNMRTLGFQPEARQLGIAQETLDIYAPLANRMGISWLKSELEDLSFRYLQPEVYRDLEARVSQRLAERARYIEETRGRLEQKLLEAGIEGEVSGRGKHLYSLHNKMLRQGVDLDQIYDLIAFRILVKSLRDCYAVLGIVHSSWKPVPGRFKDYIAMPKGNMYQSLHTTVVGPDGERMEVQIRTEEMHRVAEEGIAAHWKYKEKGVAVAGDKDDRRFAWLRQMLESQQELKDSREFMDSVRFELFPEEVYVFTPNGEVKELPRGSTPVDFAFAVHTDVGFRCVGARVNGKLVPLKTPLHNGDAVEILTAANQTPSKDWLKFVHSTKARNKIRQWIKTAEREKSITIGRDVLEKELRKYGLGINRTLASDESARAVEDLGFQSADDLLAGLGYGKVPLGQVIGRLVPQEKLREEPARPGALEREADKRRKKPANAIRIHGVDDIMVRFAKCCTPLPGDAVVGFITRGRGVTVHAADCPHARDSDPERRIDVEWDMKKKATRAVKIRVHCQDQKGILASITGAITNSEANIVSAQVLTLPDQKGVNTFEVDVADLDHLNRVINALMKIKGVLKVERMRSQA